MQQTANYVNHVHYTVLYYILRELNPSCVTINNNYISVLTTLTTIVYFAISL